MSLIIFMIAVEVLRLGIGQNRGRSIMSLFLDGIMTTRMLVRLGQGRGERHQKRKQ